MIKAGGDDLRRWVDSLGSASTRAVWPRTLGTFCLDTGKNPAELVSAASETTEHGQKVAIRNLFADYDKRERAKGKKGSTIQFTIKVVKSWLVFNGFQLPKGLFRIRDSDRVYRERAFSKEHERAMLRLGNERSRASVALARSGLRGMVQGSYDGTDGLRVRDLVDLRIEGRTRSVSWKQTPARIVVRQELSKGRHEYSTFLSSENCEHVAAYLQSRLRPHARWKKAENLGPDSPVIAPTAGRKHFITTTNIGDILRGQIRRAGFTSRPYAFRTTFATRMISCESEGLVPHSFVQFWMGHTGDMTARYAQNRGDLPSEVIEKMRDSFRRCEETLAAVQQPSRETERIERNVLLLQIAGFSEEEARAHAGDHDAAIADLARTKLGRRAHVEVEPATRVGEERPVEAAAVRAYLLAGWKYRGPVAGTDFTILAWPGTAPLAAQDGE